MKAFRIIFSLAALTLLISNSVKAQVQPRKVIQLSGVVVTDDSLKAVPFVNVYVKSKFYGTTSDYYGYFSLPVVCGDTIQFSSVGFKKSTYIIPQSMVEDRYTMIHVVYPNIDTLGTVVIYPWPSKDQFKDAFLSLNVPDDEIARAEKNLDPEAIYKSSQTLPTSGALNFKYQMQQRTDQLYYNGQAPPITVLNPFAWAQFIKAWKEGKFKRQESTNK